MAQSSKPTAGAMPWRYVGVPVCGLASMTIPACAPATAESQVAGAPVTCPPLYSSGYSPNSQTCPELSCAPNQSSDSWSWLSWVSCS